MINYKYILMPFLIIFFVIELFGQSPCNNEILNSRLGMLFIENKGQLISSDGTDADSILFYVVDMSKTIYITKKGFHFTETSNGNSDSKIKSEKHVTKIQRTSMNFLNTSNSAEIIALEPSDHSLNFYYPHCPGGITGVRSFKRIRLNNVFRGIDLELKFTSDNNFKFDYIVHPGADFKDIAYSIEGSEFEANDKIIDYSAGNKLITETIPEAYLDDGKKSNIECRYFSENGLIGFKVEDYDRTKTLVIDPEIRFATFFGGEDGDHGTGMALDRAENMILAGYTISRYFPVTSGAIQTVRGGIYDIFAAKFDQIGTLLWATYYGGKESDFSSGVCLDNIDNIYISGFTWSYNIPITDDAFQLANAGGENDGFILSLDKFGKRRWATYFGGTLDEHIYGIACNGNSEIALAGRTTSWDLTGSSSYLRSKNLSSAEDAFLLRLDLFGAFISGTYLGGGNEDAARAVTYDAEANILIAGYTNSMDFPVINPGTGDKTKPESKDIMLAKFLTNGQFALDYTRLYGGTGRDEAWAIKTDNSSKIVLAGSTYSSNFPMAGMPIQNLSGGSEDAFVLKLNQSARIEWSTYFGGGSEDIGTSLAISKDDCITLVGRTQSNNLKLKGKPLLPYLNGLSDIFAVKIDPSGMFANWGMYVGGKSNEWAWSAVSDKGGNIYICGATESIDFPVTNFAPQKTNAGMSDAYIIKLCSTVPLPEVELFGNIPFCPGDSVVLRVTLPFDRYIWSTTERSRGITIKNPGSYYVTVFDTNGCSGVSDTIQITMYSPPQPVITGRLGFCKGENTSISVEGNYKAISWSNGASSKSINVSQVGTYKVTVTDEKGCKGSSSVVVYEYPNPMPIIRGPATVCAFSVNNIYKITPDPRESYTWSVIGGDMVYGVDSISVIVAWSGGGKGMVTVRTVNDITGCWGVDTFYVDISEKLQPEIVSNTGKFEFCEGDSILLNAGSDYFETIWSNGSIEPEIVIKNPGFYHVLVRDQQGCEGSDTIEIKVNPNPNPTISGANIVCEYSNGVLYQTPEIADHSYNWTVEGGYITQGESSSQIYVNWDAAGIGIIKLSEIIDESACNAVADSFIVEILPLPKPKLVPLGLTEFCRGDSVAIILDADYNDIQWNNGYRTKSIKVKSGGIYFADVIDENGCGGRSDTISVVVHELPEQPVISKNGDVLKSSSGPYYRWYKNGFLMTGRDSDTILANTAGIYLVEVFDDNGCKLFSEPFEVIRGYLKVKAGIEDTLFVKTGIDFTLPIKIIEAKNLDMVQASKFRGKLTFNPTIMLQSNIYNLIEFDEDSKTIEFEGSLQSSGDILIKLDFHSVLGAVACTELILDSLVWIAAPVDVELQNGLLCLEDLCKTGENTRLVGLSNKLELLQNRPNPFEHATDIEFSLIESGMTSIEIVDLLGNTRKIAFSGELTAGNHLLRFDAGDLSSGLYYYILRTPTQVISKKMKIMK